MSYCRWSNDNFRCDLYCYESRLGYETHIRSSRYEKVPDFDPIEDFFQHKITAEEYAEQSRKHLAELAATPLVEINLPHAGESFCDATLEDFCARLIHLRELGYQFPNSVFDIIDAEIRKEFDE